MKADYTIKIKDEGFNIKELLTKIKKPLKRTEYKINKNNTEYTIVIQEKVNKFNHKELLEWIEQYYSDINGTEMYNNKNRTVQTAGMWDINAPPDLGDFSGTKNFSNPPLYKVNLKIK